MILELADTEVLFYFKKSVSEILKQVFENTETGLWISFACSRASFLNETTKLLEGRYLLSGLGISCNRSVLITANMM